MIGVNKLTVNFGERFLFDDISFIVKKQDRIGLTGKNGAGKSTLLKILHGDISPSKGSVSVPNDFTIGYLPQDLEFNDGKTVLDEVKTAFEEELKLEQIIDDISREITEREDYESDSYMQLLDDLNHHNERLSLLDTQNREAKIEKVLLGLGFEQKQFNNMTETFSGGWRMRLELAKVLLKHSDLILLDEPTNHLDIESIQWLESFIKTYQGAVLLISHDKAFLDNCTKRTIEISLGKVYDYPANYSKYLIMRAERREQQLAAYTNQQKQIKDTEAFISKFRYKATKSNQVQSRVKQLEKLDRVEIDAEDKKNINIKFPPAPRSGKVVIEAKDVDKNYGSKEVLSDISLFVERGDKLAFVGKNGEGKSTFTRLIIEEEQPTNGIVKIGHNISLGYYAQNQDATLNSDKTVFETIDDIAEGDMRTKVRGLLGAFMFDKEASDKKISVLSGGERARVALCKLLLAPVNLLVMDEPTNHLDIPSKEVLKKALNEYDGTLIIVSHDRDFLKGLTQKVFEFKSKKIKEFTGDVDDFLAERKMEDFREFESTQLDSKTQKKNKDKSSNNKQDYQEKKKTEKKIRKLNNQQKRLEREIEAIEKEIEEKNEKMMDPEHFSHEASKELHKTNQLLDDKMKSWEETSKKLEKEKAQAVE